MDYHQKNDDKSNNIKHTREDDVLLNVEEIKDVNQKLKESKYLLNDYLTMRRLELEQEILKSKNELLIA